MFLVAASWPTPPRLGGFRERCKASRRAVQQEVERPLGLPRAGWACAADPAAKAGQGVVVARADPGSAADRQACGPETGSCSSATAEVVRPTVFAQWCWLPRIPFGPHRAARREEPIEMQLNLAGNPSRLGITWRGDDAEPGVSILTRVLPGSPADAAGLRAGDRIYQIGGRDFTSPRGISRPGHDTAGPPGVDGRNAGSGAPSDAPSGRRDVGQHAGRHQVRRTHGRTLAHLGAGAVNGSCNPPRLQACTQPSRCSSSGLPPRVP